MDPTIQSTPETPPQQPQPVLAQPAVPQNTVPVQAGIPWKLLLLGLALLGAIVVFGGTTQIEPLARLLSKVLLYGGLGWAAFCGYCVARLVSNSVNLRNSSTTTGSNSPLLLIGVILCATSIIFGIVTLIPGVILIILGSKAQAGSSPNTTIVRQPIKNAAKITLVVLGFFGGFVPAVFLMLVLALLVSQHACQLSSSKCM